MRYLVTAESLEVRKVVVEAQDDDHAAFQYRQGLWLADLGYEYPAGEDDVLSIEPYPEEQ